MSEAPERIWLDVKSESEVWAWDKRCAFDGDIEYIRADIHVAAIARAERAEIEAAFFQGEVKLRNRIPATADPLADLLRSAERAEAALALAEEALREISDNSHNLWEVSVARKALAKIAALKGTAE